MTRDNKRWLWFVIVSMLLAYDVTYYVGAMVLYLMKGE